MAAADAATLAALQNAALKECASWYERGMRDWRDLSRIAEVDSWMRANEGAAKGWLLTLARNNRDALLELAAE